MDPLGILGVTASIIACIQLSGSLLKRIGPSNYSKKDLNNVLISLYAFRGAYEGLRLHLELNGEDEARLSALQHLEQPLSECKRALDKIEKRLRNLNFIGQHVIGSFWDGGMKKCLQRLDEAKELFELALHADQQ